MSYGPYLQLLLERVEGGKQGAGGWGGERGAVEEGVQGVEAGEDKVDALLGLRHAGLGVGEQGVAQGGGRVHDLEGRGGRVRGDRGKEPGNKRAGICVSTVDGERKR